MPSRFDLLQATRYEVHLQPAALHEAKLETATTCRAQPRHPLIRSTSDMD